jgi:hypothetical protein
MRLVRIRFRIPNTEINQWKRKTLPHDEFIADALPVGILAVQADGDEIGGGELGRGRSQGCPTAPPVKNSAHPTTASARECGEHFLSPIIRKEKEVFPLKCDDPGFGSVMKTSPADFFYE